MIHPVEKRCGNCRTELQFLKREYMQLGKTGWVTGDWPNLIAGALDIDIWCCPACGKLEFYRGGSSGNLLEEEYAEDRMAQIVCHSCGQSHDLDDPKCPFCGAKNPNI